MANYAGTRVCRVFGIVVQFDGSRTRGAYDLTFDAAIIEEGLSLTVIGVSTAFALLLILSAGIWAGRQVLWAEGGLRRRCGLVLGGEARQGSRGRDRRQRAPRNTR